MFLAVLNSLGVPTKKRDTHADWIYRRGAARERSAYSPWQFHVNKCRGRGVAPSRASRGGVRRRVFARFARPIAARRDVTAGQSARDVVTARAKYSRYISRPVATANYPQSRAGGRRKRTGGLRADREIGACAVRGVWTAPGHGTLLKVSAKSASREKMTWKNRSTQKINS